MILMIMMKMIKHLLQMMKMNMMKKMMKMKIKDYDKSKLIHEFCIQNENIYTGYIEKDYYFSMHGSEGIKCNKNIIIKLKSMITIPEIIEVLFIKIVIYI